MAALVAGFPTAPVHGLSVFPNPIRRAGHVRYTLQESGPVRIALWDLQGRKVRDLETGVQAAGPHDTTWDGTDALGHAVATGVYILGFQAGSYHRSERVLLLR